MTRYYQVCVAYEWKESEKIARLSNALQSFGLDQEAETLQISENEQHLFDALQIANEKTGQLWSSHGSGLGAEAWDYDFKTPEERATFLQVLLPELHARGLFPHVKDFLTDSQPERGFQDGNLLIGVCVWDDEEDE